MTSKKLSIAATGYRGFDVVRRLVQENIPLARVVSYRQSNGSQYFQQLKELCHQKAIPFAEQKRPSPVENEILVAVGWQFLLSGNSDQIVVLHDSILPRYRGFAPTPTALINGETEIGMTALHPIAAVDAGPIICQKTASIHYPIRLKKAYEIQDKLACAIIEDIYKDLQSGKLTSRPQSETHATYSLWRGQQDFYIDWEQSANRIVRTIDALSEPLAGARAVIDNTVIIIESGNVLQEREFEIRQAGKIFGLDNGIPSIVCGVGCIEIASAITLDGKPYLFSRLRTGFTTSSNFLALQSSKLDQ